MTLLYDVIHFEEKEVQEYSEGLYNLKSKMDFSFDQ